MPVVHTKTVLHASVSGNGNRQKNKTKRFMSIMNRDKYLYLLLVIPILYFIVFHYLPMYGVTIAFKDYNLFKGIFDSEWIGFNCFKEIFASKEFYKVLRNTLGLNLLDFIFGFPAPIILAMILNEIRCKWFKKISQTVLYLPHFLSWVIIGGIIYQVFSNDGGVVNEIIQAMGLPPVHFLSDSRNWIIVYVFSGIWQGAGWGTILYLAAITGINSELYEAAEVDGATRIQRMWHITLPGIKPTIVILLILSVGNMVNIGFDRPFVLSNSVVIDVGDVISTYAYRVGLGAGRFNIATAVGLFQSVVGIVFLFATNSFAKLFDEQGIW